MLTAFARDPVRVDIKHANLQVIRGDVLDPASVEKAVQGHDAVLCSLGAGRKGAVRSEGTRNIIHAMEKAGVRRFICQSTLGVGDSRDNLSFFRLPVRGAHCEARIATVMTDRKVFRHQVCRSDFFM